MYILYRCFFAVFFVRVTVAAKLTRNATHVFDARSRRCRPAGFRHPHNQIAITDHH